MINVSHPGVLDLIADHRCPDRWDSAAFLIWYLENYGSAQESDEA